MQPAMPELQSSPASATVANYSVSSTAHWEER